MHTREIHDGVGQIGDHDDSGQGRGVAGQPVVNPGSEEKRPRLIGTLARALRHEPEQYGIELDGGGWADLGALVEHIGGAVQAGHGYRRVRCFGSSKPTRTIGSSTPTAESEPSMGIA